MNFSNERSFLSVFLDDPHWEVGAVAAGCGVLLLLKGTPAEMTALDYAGGSLALAGALLILLSMKRAAVCARLSREGTGARGRVTAIKQERWTSSYTLRYRFRDRSGTEVEGRQFLSQVEAFDWREGDEGEVCFDAADSANSVWLGKPYLGLENAARAYEVELATPAAAPSSTGHSGAPSAPAALPSRRVLVSRSQSTRWAWIIFWVFLFTALCLGIMTVQVVTGQSVADSGYAIYAVVVAVLLAASVYKFVAGRREVTEQLRVLRDGIPANAVVTRVEEKRLRGRGGIITFLIGWIVSYDYTDSPRVTHSADSGFLSMRDAARWRVGDSCPVIIDPDNAASSVWVG